MERPSVRPLSELHHRRSQKWMRFEQDVVPAFVAEMDFELAPGIKQVLLDAVQRSDTGYANPGNLFTAFTGFAQRRHNWTVDPGLLRLLPDVMTGVDVVISAFTKPGDKIAVTPPVYPPFYGHITALDRVVDPVPLERTEQGWNLDFPALEACFSRGTKVFLLCSPHNPLGRVWTVQELTRLAELARAHDVLVISDEIHAPLTLPGAIHTPYTTLPGGAGENGIVITSASKAFDLAGLKAAVLVPGAEIATRLGELSEEVGFRASLFGVLAGEAAWSGEDAWQDGVVAQLDDNRQLLSRLLADLLPGAVYLPPAASYLAWVDCRRLGLGDDPAAQFLERGNVAVSNGADFGRQGQGWIRLTFATSPEILTEIVTRMASALAG